jgi:hypothetical protein
MTIVIEETEPARPGHLVAGAVGSIATRTSFLVVAWFLLTGEVTLPRLAILAAGQVLAYLVFSPVGVWFATRTGPGVTAVTADLLSACAIAGLAFYYTDWRWLGGGLAAVAALRAIADRARDAYRAAPEAESDEDAPPVRVGLARVGFFVLGAFAGVAASWFGPMGLLWFTAFTFVAAAATTAWTMTGPAPAAEEEPANADIWRGGMPWLLVMLFITHLLAQVAAVVLLVTWWGQGLPVEETLGYAGGAFAVGALAGGVMITSLVRHPSGVLALCLGFLIGGGAIAVRAGVPPVKLILVIVALIAGVAFASVAPAMGTLLSHRVPPKLRARVGGIATSVAYASIPFGTVGAAYLLGRYDGLIIRIAIGGGALLLAMLVPVVAGGVWGLLLADVPSMVNLLGGGRLPARLSVTLAYANGEWLIEVRRGRALLGRRHLVKSAEALSMLSMLNVPGVHARVEEALTVDQTEATRQVERMRGELAELEAKLAGLTEMVQLSDARSTSPNGVAKGTVKPGAA